MTHVWTTHTLQPELETKQRDNALVTEPQASVRGQETNPGGGSLCAGPQTPLGRTPSWWEEVWLGPLPSACSLQFTKHFPTSNPRGGLAGPDGGLLTSQHSHLEGPELDGTPG